MPTERILRQLGQLAEICEHFGMKKRIFLADEEFVGGINDRTETERISALARGIIDANLQIKFDPAARVDQVYSSKEDIQWHTSRLEMWNLCLKSGMERLFMGVESGSDSQLKRYGKGIRVEHSIFAIRLLSALGIPLRFGFITFDPLMVGLRELKENIVTLSRTDAFMRPVDMEKTSYRELFLRMTQDDMYVTEQAVGIPVASGVSYMMASLEVLIGSPYVRMLEIAERKNRLNLLLNDKKPDTNMGRYSVAYADPLIQEISIAAQKWIDRHFPVAYTLKSLYKVAPANQRKLLMSWMVSYRNICLLLLSGIIEIFDDTEVVSDQDDEPVSRESFFRWAVSQSQGVVPNSLFSNLNRLYIRRVQEADDASLLLRDCLDVFDELVHDEMDKVTYWMKKELIVDRSGRLADVLSRWYNCDEKWVLTNDPDRIDQG